MDYLIEITGSFVGKAWGLPAIILLVGTGLFLSIYLKFVQFRGFKHALRLIAGKYDKEKDEGEVSHFKALVTALSATVGTGNIAGVAGAVAIGGPGALFWMWITALVGMASKYASCTLALKYRTIHDDGKVSGGPMYTIAKGLGLPWLGFIFALFTLIASFGIGNMVQASEVVNGLNMAVPVLGDIPYANNILGAILAISVGIVIIGGFKRIATVASYVVPFMAIAYCIAALFIILMNYEKVPQAFAMIFGYAVTPGAFGGAAIGTIIQVGVARGVFSNESGLGSAPMAHAAAKTNEPVREGLVASIGPFIDTIIICTMTGLVLVISDAWVVSKASDITGAALTAYTFKGSLGVLGTWVVGFGLVFFAYSTMIAWSYYGDRSAEYMFGEKAVLPYRLIYVILIILGASTKPKLIWNLADIANIFMALPNLISLIFLAVVTKKLTDKYFTDYKKYF